MNTMQQIFRRKGTPQYKRPFWVKTKVVEVQNLDDLNVSNLTQYKGNCLFPSTTQCAIDIGNAIKLAFLDFYQFQFRFQSLALCRQHFKIVGTC
jgi:hypothetical protein